MRIIQPVMDEFFRYGNHHEAYVDDASYELILDIQKELSVFQPVEDDEARVVWLEIPRGTADEWKAIDRERGREKEEEDGESYQEVLDDWYPRGTKWFFVVTSRYRDDSFLKISDRCHDFIVLRRREARRNSYSVDLSWLLERLLETIKERVVEIMASPDGYAEHLAKNLPPRQRKGRIRSRDLHRIVPSSAMQTVDRQKRIDAMKELIRRKSVYEGSKDAQELPDDYWASNGVPAPFHEMTIRRFCRFYRIADTVFKNSSDVFEHDKLDVADDIRYYEECGLHGSLDKYDVDCVKDFKKFAKDHYGELGLSRMNVGAHDCYVSGKWLVTFSISYSAYIDTGLDIAMALYETGAPFIYYKAANTLSVLDESGWVRIKPYTFHDYLECDGEDEGVFSMPFIEDCGLDDEISTEQFMQIVENAEWEREMTLKPDNTVCLDDRIYDLIRDETDKPMTMSEIRHALETKYHIYMSVYYSDDDNGYYYIYPKSDRQFQSSESERHLFESFNEAMYALISEFNAVKKGEKDNENTVHE